MSLDHTYSLAEHRQRHDHLHPSEQLAAFWRLPEQEQVEAFAELAREVERERETAERGPR